MLNIISIFYDSLNLDFPVIKRLFNTKLVQFILLYLLKFNKFYFIFKLLLILFSKKQFFTVNFFKNLDFDGINFFKSIQEVLRRVLFETEGSIIVNIYEIYYFDWNLGNYIEFIYSYFLFYVVGIRFKFCYFNICIFYVLFGLYCRLEESNLDVNFNFILYLELLALLINSILE